MPKILLGLCKISSIVFITCILYLVYNNGDYLIFMGKIQMHSIECYFINPISNNLQNSYFDYNNQITKEIFALICQIKLNKILAGLALVSFLVFIISLLSLIYLILWGNNEDNSNKNSKTP